MSTEIAQLQHRRDTAANWTSNNPTLAAGEKGIESDTGYEKTGDGATAWTGLKYTIASPLGVSVSSNPTGAGLIPTSTGTTSQVGSWLGTTTLAANATIGFMGIPTVSGAPTGTPTTVANETHIAFNSTTGEIAAYNSSTSTWHGIGPTYTTMGRLPSGDTTGATDYANLTADYAAMPTGGKFVFRRGHYYINAPLQWTKHSSIEGENLNELWQSATSGTTNTSVPGAIGTNGVPVYPAPFSGVVVEQVTAATDVFQLTGASTSINVKNVCGTFASAILNTNTGHVFNCAPTQTYLTGLDDGLMGFTFRNCAAWGHDGNHYGFTWTNPILGQLYNLRSYGGGGFRLVANTALSAYGNLVFTHPYCSVSNVGTADGYHFDVPTIAFPGGLGLCTFIRPQAQAGNLVNVAGTQMGWNDNGGAGYPNHNTLIAPDLENWALMGINTNGTTVAGGFYIPCNGGAYSSYGQNALLGAGALASVTTGTQNTAMGTGALQAVTTGSSNTALGFQAGNAITTLSSSTAIGYKALTVGTGANNVAVGSTALVANTSGAQNTAVGTGALAANTTTASSTALGYHAAAVSTGGQTTALGYQALAAQTTATGNTAVGFNTLSTITTTNGNTGVGWSVMTATGSTVSNCTGMGMSALAAATTSIGSTAVGYQALAITTTGASNTAIGAGAGYTPAGASQNATITGQRNTFVGYFTGMAGTGDFSNSVAIGYEALVNGHYAVAIGSTASAGASGAVAIGTDHTSAGAAATVQDTMVFGTGNHTSFFAGSAQIGGSGKSLGFFGTAVHAQPTALGTTTGFTAATGTAVLAGSTFTGGSGASAYTMGDVVLALKQLGIVAV